MPSGSSHPFPGAEARPRVASLVDLDPDLFESLPEEERRLARRYLTVRLEYVARGTWEPTADTFAVEGAIGLLVTDGIAVRRVTFGHRSAIELLGPGDILRPWQDDGEFAMFPLDPQLRVLAPLTLAALDSDFAGRAAHFPALTGTLVGRATDRAGRMAAQLALSQITAVDRRVLVMLWNLAERWGKVRRDGVLLELHLTHELLGFLVGARRPSVTTALGKLAEEGLVVTPRPHSWLLCGEPPAELAERGRSGGAGSAGPAPEPVE